MLLMIVGLAIVLLTLFLFASPKLSPIPYFPTHSQDLDSILNFLDLKNNRVVLDLGAGGGLIIFKAAAHSFNKNLNTEFIAVESNPILFAVIWIKRLFHPNRKRVHIFLKDLFTTDYQKLLKKTLNGKRYSPVFYFYLTPWLVEPAYNQIVKTVPSTDIISYFYPLKIKAAKQKQGKNKIYFYTIKK